MYPCENEKPGFVGDTCRLWIPCVPDIPVFPTDRGWQPVQISSWWWCICWNETLFPALVSGGLCTLPCISPSFWFYLRVWERKIMVIIWFDLKQSSGGTGRLTVLGGGCMPDLSAHGIFISCVLHLHIFTLATETQIGLFDLVLRTVWWISSSHQSNPSLTCLSETYEIKDEKIKASVETVESTRWWLKSTSSTQVIVIIVLCIYNISGIYSL